MNAMNEQRYSVYYLGCENKPLHRYFSRPSLEEAVQYARTKESLVENGFTVIRERWNEYYPFRWEKLEDVHKEKNGEILTLA